MKQLLFYIFILLPWFGCAQATFSGQMRIPTENEVFGINISVGNTIYCVGEKKYYLCIEGALSNENLVSAAGKFIQIADTAWVDNQAYISVSYTHLTLPTIYSV